MQHCSPPGKSPLQANIPVCIPLLLHRRRSRRRRGYEFVWEVGVGSFAGEGTAGGGRLGRGRVAGSLVAPSWLKPCANAWVRSGGGCQGAMVDPAPGQIGRRRPTLLNLHGQGGGQGGKAV